MAHWTATGTPSRRALAAADTDTDVASYVRVGRLLPDVREHFFAPRRRAARRSLGRLILQPAARGALPTLYAAAAPDARGGRYYGPTGVMEMRGPLGFAKLPAAATGAQAAIRLWAISEQLGDARYPSRLTD